MIRRLLAFVLLILFAVSCAYGAAMKKGDRAYEAGDWGAALGHYETALEKKPDSAQAAQRVREAKEQMVGEAGEKARSALAAGDLLGAMDAARSAWDRLPEADATKAIIQDVSNATFARAQELQKEGDYANALMLYQSIGATLPSEEAKAQPRAQEVQSAWVSELVNTATTAEEAGRLGDAVLAWAKLTQLTADPGHGGNRDRLRTQILREWAYWVKLQTRRQGSEVAPGVVRTSGPTALRVAAELPSGAETDATAKIDLTRVRFRTDQTTRIESVEYQSGTKQVENPFYKSRQDELLREQQRLTDYENDVTKYENDVSQDQERVAREGDTPGVSTSAEQSLSRARSSLESARRRVQDQRNQVQRAREDLADTPPTTEEPVYSLHEFTVTTQTLTGEATLNVTVQHADGRPAIEVSVPVALSASDDTHPPQSIAGVAADPLDLPTRASLEATVLQRARKLADEQVMASFESWRSAMVEAAVNAASDDERVNLYGIYIVTNPANVTPKVAADISAMRGIPDPVKVLSP